MMQRLYRAFSILLLFAMLLPASVMAQLESTPEPVPPVEFIATVIECDADPGYVRASELGGALPPGCAPLAGVYLTFSTDAGEAQVCWTSEAGSCVVTVPADQGVTVSADYASLATMTPLQNPIYRAAGDLDGTLIAVSNVVEESTPTETATDEATPTEDVPSDDQGESTPTMEVTETPIGVTETPTESTPASTPVLTNRGSSLAVASATSGPEQPVTGQELAIGTGGVACYVEPNTASEIITTIGNETLIDVTGRSGGFLRVNCGGFGGYVNTAQTSLAWQPGYAQVSAEMISRAASGATTCFSAPSSESTPFAGIPNGTIVSITGRSFGWLRVNCAGRTGYIQPSDTTLAWQRQLPILKYEMAVATGAACYTAPATSSTHYASFSSGQLVPVGGANRSDGWLPVICGGRDGYVRTVLTSLAGWSPLPRTSLEMVTGVGAGSLICYTAPHASSAQVTSFTNRALINVTGPARADGWLPVTCSGRNGFVYARLTTVASILPLAKANGKTTVWTNVSGGSVCWSAPTPLSTRFATLSASSVVNTTGSAVNGWLPVQCAGKNGFIQITDTTLRLPSGAMTTKPAVVVGTSSGLNCRTAPVDGQVINVMPNGSRVEVYSTNSGWALVKCGSMAGFVSLTYLSYNIGYVPGAGTVWIDVNLSTQYMRVYQGNTVIGQTYVSTGRYPQFETPTGTFWINTKYVSQTMAGTLGGESYYVPNVPHVMYFTNYGHAIHGAYWHHNFGYRMSHGCVNLPLGFAGWLYSISPIGTRVVIHY